MNDAGDQLNPMLRALGAPIDSANYVDNFDWGSKSVSFKYVIFMTGRCGSTLLAQALKDTRLCGSPDEFFSEEFIAYFASQRGTLMSFREYFSEVVSLSTTNDRFGFQIDPLRFAAFIETVDFQRVFLDGGCAMFWMTRRDIVSQGYSYLHAKKTGLWHDFVNQITPTNIGRATVSDRELWQEIILILQNEAIMRRFFGAAGINPVSLDYEMVATDLTQTIVLVLRKLRCTPTSIASAVRELNERTHRMTYNDRHTRLADFILKFEPEIDLLTDPSRSDHLGKIVSRLKEHYEIHI